MSAFDSSLITSLCCLSFY